MTNKPRTRQEVVTARAAVTTRTPLNSSGGKAKSVLTRSSRNDKTDSVQDPNDENKTIAVEEAQDRLQSGRDFNPTLTLIELEDDKGEEKENVPPKAYKVSRIRQLETPSRVEAEDSKDSKDLVQESITTKRKWSSLTRVVKELEYQEYDTDDSDQDNKENKVDLDEDYKDDDPSSHQTTSKLKRVAGGKPSRTQEPEMSEYERQRLENIKQNQEILQLLKLPVAATQMQVASLEGKQEESSKSSSVVRIRREFTKSAPKIVQPVRVSKRIRGIAVEPLQIGDHDTVEKKGSQIKGADKNGTQENDTQENGTQENGTQENDADTGDEDEEDTANLMSGDLFFDKETREKAIRVDGHYKGWLNPVVVERYGFEKSAQEAWEANGGGIFSFKDPLGANGSTGTSKSKSYGRQRQEAREVSKAMFKKNPNAYFYRHNEPGQEQWTGDWTEEEGVLFLKVVKENGCGDKWGLFASYIPHRVGYQCSNYYRQVVLPQGLVFDSNYEYTSRGKPIYCGKYNQRRD
ncbi:hypothetical protein BGZ65_009112 [Modicella reniformis]|uniref:Myb-like domain-containing protein n=1 Tax=Modicella reniformis TaxID=1440133 RepID=A0A9P6IN21_9FUNG|nr:hypothetical protein BGZ65_009112 [Modicella reniformis]